MDRTTTSSSAPSSAKAAGSHGEQSVAHHILTVTVENKPGVLSRVAGLFSRRAFNIFSLAVSPTDDERFSRMTIVVDAESAPLEQIVKQLNKLIPVIKITEVAPGDGVERELMMVTVQADPEARGQVTELASIFDGKIVDVGHDSLTIMVAGQSDKLDAFSDLAKPFGIVELQRTGPDRAGPPRPPAREASVGQDRPRLACRRPRLSRRKRCPQPSITTTMPTPA